MRRLTVPWARALILISVTLSTPIALSAVAWSTSLPQPTGLALDILTNAEYSVEIPPTAADAMPQELTIQLAGGLYADDAHQVRLLPELIRYGDFTGNGVDEAIVILETTGAETDTESRTPGNTSYSLAIMLAQEQTPLNLVTLPLGQDVTLETVEIVNGEIAVNLIANQPLTQIFVLENDQVLQFEIPGLTPASLANATYTNTAVAEEAITLVDGEFSAPQAEDAAGELTVRTGDAQAFGDLNDDLVPDAAIILASSGGASGTFIDLAAVLNMEGAPENVDTVLLGDRVRIEDMFIQDGLIVLDAVTHAEDDPLCCPTQNERLAFALADNALQAAEIEQPLRTVSAPYGPLFVAAGPAAESTTDTAPDTSTDTAPDTARYGYVNLAGEFIIAPQFAGARRFVEGLAAVEAIATEEVATEEDSAGAFGYIDATGSYVIEPQFSFAGDFHQGVAVVGLPDGQQGYINRQGELLFDGATFAEAMPFNEGMAAVRLANQDGNQEGNAEDNDEDDEDNEAGSAYGYIDRRGNLVIEPRFATAESFANGLALISIEEQYGFIDRSGRLAIAAQFPRSAGFAEGLAPIELFGQFGYINMRGDLAIRPQFEMASAFREGFALVTLEGQPIYIDPAGNVLNSDVSIDRGSPFHEGLAAVTIDGLVGYLNSAGELALPPQYMDGSDFENGMAVVRTESAWGVIDPNGAWLLQLPLRPE